MANWRDRRPSDDDIPSTEDYLRQFHKRGNSAAKVRRTVVRDDPDEVGERPIWAKVLIRRDWILAGLVCLVLILQIWHMAIGHVIDERDDPPPERVGGGVEQSPLGVGSVPDGLMDPTGFPSPSAPVRQATPAAQPAN